MGRRAAATRGLVAGGQAEGLTLDAGALIALERSHERLLALIDRLVGIGGAIAIPAAALSQAWRASSRQHALAVLLTDDGVEVPGLDLRQALTVGALLAATGTSDVVDASVVVTARERRHCVVTSDADDLRRLDSSLTLIEI